LGKINNHTMSPSILRRNLLMASLWSAAGVWALPQRTLRFPRDFGAHKDFRTEWWYLTGHATAEGRPFGFQLTFFRSRVDATQSMASRLAARQLIFAHAALTDVQGKRLWHDQRIARSSGATELDLASTSENDTAVELRGWSLQRGAGGYRARIMGSDFALELQFTERQPLLLQGNQGLSRKGPDANQASYYYSQPQLAVRGEVTLKGQKFGVDDRIEHAAWLDHEWSQALLHPDAVGWDWIGMNLFDGSALTAFRLRDKTGVALWDGGSFRAGGSHMKDAPYVFSRGEVLFRPMRHWKSPLSQASYPVEWIVRTPADFYTVKAVIDRQELDSRASTGAIYWEGLSDLFDSQGRHVGRGYLEMTGYAAVLRM
jgi:predicted secreted hydrolase